MLHKITLFYVIYWNASVVTANRGLSWSAKTQVDKYRHAGGCAHNSKHNRPLWEAWEILEVQQIFSLTNVSPCLHNLPSCKKLFPKCGNMLNIENHSNNTISILIRMSPPPTTRHTCCHPNR